MFFSALHRLTAALVLAGCALTLHAEPVPGVRGIDHIGITVPDIGAATHFFTDVLGCKAVMSFGPFSDPKGTFMKDLLHVDKRAVIEKISQVRCGNGSNLELFQYKVKGQKKLKMRNSDIGAYHVAIYVDDIKAAADKLKAAGLKTFMGPVPIDDGPAAGQSILYFLTPWGMQMEAISYPNGMAYEKSTSERLWSPRDAR